MNKIISISLLFVFSFSAFAQNNNKKLKEMEFSPQSKNLSSFDNNYLLSIDCEGDKPFTYLNCHMAALTISSMTDKEKKKQNQDWAQLDKATQKDIEQMKKFYADINNAKYKERLNRMTPEQKSYSKDFDELSKNFAKINTIAELKKEMIKLNDMQANTCTVRIHRWDVQLKKISAHKWGSSAEPSGLCNVVAYAELESTDDNFLLWKYSTNTLSADTSNQLCSFITVGKKETYSWDAPRISNPNCKYLSYE